MNPYGDYAAAPSDSIVNHDRGFLQRVGKGLTHSFTTLIGDLAPYLLVGYLLAGLVSAVFGDFIHDPSGYFGGVWLPYVGAILIGLPLYICASASTPLAAVLLAAGFPPGAILVFLMVGPASNLATLAVVKKILGLAASVRYVLSILIVAVFSGLALDRVYTWLGFDPQYTATADLHATGWFALLCAVVLSALVLWHSGRWAVAKVR